MRSVSISSLALVVIVCLCLTSVEASRGRHRHGQRNGQRRHGNQHHQHHSQHRHATATSDSSSEGSGCDDDEYQCQGPLALCVPTAWRCDNDPDCPQHDDETNCTASEYPLPPLHPNPHTSTDTRPASILKRSSEFKYGLKKQNNIIDTIIKTLLRPLTRLPE
ncbi:prolow-density lipoprotein receptor-related protein 1 [Elysia marginata]|uniref:Prolow-density lipoprotein receptor-related protein 1 n=1 Tax=Elysia marginata TaxID=1093978 RepID=A0AAV4JUY7_9GAST|nr:prolow-density lipoprotein receptor-related protein 1 [Elysia marginata]